MAATFFFPSCLMVEVEAIRGWTWLHLGAPRMAGMSPETHAALAVLCLLLRWCESDPAWWVDKLVWPRNVEFGAEVEGSRVVVCGDGLSQAEAGVIVVEPSAWPAAIDVVFVCGEGVAGEVAIEVPAKPSIPEVIDAFRAYYAKNPAWGSLHVVLDDGNMRDCDVNFCVTWAEERGDETGARLARILRRMSRTQRRKIAREACSS